MAPATTWTIPPAILSCEVNWIGPHRMPWCKPVGMAPRLGKWGDSIQDFLDNQINRFTIMVRLFHLYLIPYYSSSCYMFRQSWSHVQTYWFLFGNPIVALLDGPLPDGSLGGQVLANSILELSWITRRGKGWLVDWAYHSISLVSLWRTIFLKTVSCSGSFTAPKNHDFSEINKVKPMSNYKQPIPRLTRRRHPVFCASAAGRRFPELDFGFFPPLGRRRCLDADHRPFILNCGFTGNV